MGVMFDKTRPLSWSSLSGFEWNKEEWYQKYALGMKPAETKEMVFGSFVDKKLQEDPLYLPQVERYPIAQHPMLAKFGDIPLIGYADGFDRPGLRLKDDKTGKKEWTQKRADETGQLTMYSLLLYLTEKIPPHKLALCINWMPTKESGDFTIQFRDNPMKPELFYTRRSMRQVLDFGMHINKTYKQMIEYCENHE